MSATPKRRPSPAPSLQLSVQYGVQPAHLPTRGALRRWTRAALMRNARITLRIVGAREARALNRRFRGRDYATNVLSFCYPDGDAVNGDIAICAPVVAREARTLRIPRAARYAHLTVHGVLHLQGYDHERPREALRMERLEARILTALGYAHPYPDE